MWQSRWEVGRLVEDIYSKKYVEISDIGYPGLSNVKSFVSWLTWPGLWLRHREVFMVTSFYFWWKTVINIRHKATPLADWQYVYITGDWPGGLVGVRRLEMSLSSVEISRSPRYVNCRNKNHIFSELTLWALIGLDMGDSDSDSTHTTNNNHIRETRPLYMGNLSLDLITIYYRPRSGVWLTRYHPCPDEWQF